MTLAHLSERSIPTPTRRRTSAVGAYRQTVRLRDKAFSLLAGRSFAAFGARSVVQLPARLVGEQRIVIGDDVFVGAGSWLQAIGDPAGEPALVIGSGTSIAGNCVLSAVARVTVGERVLMARNVYVADHAHAYDDLGTAVLDQGLTRIEPVEIGAGSWLCQNVVVGPGVRIGRGAVVGANAVVLDDVPAFSVAVGAPARIVRTLAPAEVGAR